MVLTEMKTDKGLYDLRDDGKSLNSRSPKYIMRMMESWTLGSAENIPRINKVTRTAENLLRKKSFGNPRRRSADIIGTDLKKLSMRM